MSIADTRREILSDIATVAREYKRDPQDVRLMAVSKVQPDERIEEALAAGQRIFGENRVQEAALRWTERKKNYQNLELHLIGPLQTNKVKEALCLFDVIHTLDREKLAVSLSDELQKLGWKDYPLLIQVNTGEEAQKSGINPAELADFIHFCTSEQNLNITGLMCIPPIDEPPALHFAFLHKLATTHGLKELSMGMSADYTKAVPLGATYIRVGTSFFGQRDK
jgi:PLP dependent protein